MQLLKCFGTIPYSLSLVRNIMLDIPGMDNWDKSFNKHEVIEEHPEENGIIKSIEYLFIKFPLMMDNRDIVQEKKVWKEYNGNKNAFLSIAKSVVHPSRPPVKKVIRAEMLISGVYLCEKNPGETVIYMINKADLKITSGADIINKAAKKTPKDFLENLINYCKKKSK